MFQRTMCISAILLEFIRLGTDEDFNISGDLFLPLLGSTDGLYGLDRLLTVCMCNPARVQCRIPQCKYPFHFLLIFSVFMIDHQKDTVNCVASGKEEHISAMDVYEMLQTGNRRYRWKHAFQQEFSARIRVDCAETAVKLKIYAKKYIANFEEKLSAETSGKKRLHKESANHSANSILPDV
ncbi:unnamed protein product [Acanthocheilonema viteae]|uniref:Uncharacterized protein n=1 Tax=Acanthocheilonema viteae TaxID=6277 RepID=A0A498SD28_ACAVI|nr:unnamed protein product [Acanthocheilonema viteae]